MVCVNGGTGTSCPATGAPRSNGWSSAWPREHPAIAFHEVRYRVKSWKHLDSCLEDAEAALDAAADPGGRRTLLLGFSMGGAVSIGVAGHPSVSTVVGLAPWIPARLDVGGMRGRRLAVIQGSLDGWIPGIPGVSPRSSRAASSASTTWGSRPATP